jgi:hypothetical protein
MRARERGFGLVGAIVLSTALLMIATALMTVVLSGFRYQHRAYLAERAVSIAEGGADFAVYKLNQPNSTYTGETGTSFGGGSYSVAVTNVDASTKQLTVTATVPSGVRPLTRRVRLTLSGTPSDTAAFNYGVQVGAGGLDMSNSSTVIGNVYSNGNAIATNTAYVVGDLWVAGASGTISGFRGSGGSCSPTNGSGCGIQKSGPTASDGNAHAHTITGSDIQRDAYYQSISSSVVGGTSHPGSADPPAAAMPISDAQINDWKAEAAAGGSQGSFTQSSGTWSLGPRKITGDLTLSNSAVLTLTGALWVTGQINVSGSAVIQVNPSFGATGTVLISDGRVTLSNSAILRGSGDPRSYLLTLSTAALDPAIVIRNSAKNDILYTTQGWIEINNSSSLKEVTGYGLRIKNSATITYDQGLSSASFTTGPGGRWAVTSWQRLN